MQGWSRERDITGPSLKMSIIKWRKEHFFGKYRKLLKGLG